MDPPEVELSRRWDELGADAASDVELPADLGSELVDRYREPHRYYHTHHHLLAVLRSLDELHAPHPVPVEARLAAWFHDAVYEGAAGADEDASARLAEERLGAAGMDPGSVQRVASMVLATARHLDPAAEHDDVTAVFLDADLSILAADAPTYDAYCVGVRREHPDVSDERFLAGRTAVVTALLERPRLFLTDRAAERYEARARANLRREQAALTARSGGDRPLR